MRDRRKDGGLLIFGVGTFAVLIMCGAAYVVARIITAAMLQVYFKGAV